MALIRPAARIKLPSGWDGYWWSVDGKDRFSIDHPSKDGECLTADPAFPGVPCKFIGYGEDAWQEAVDAAREAGLPIENVA